MTDLLYSAGIWLYRQGVRVAGLSNRKAVTLDRGLKMVFKHLRREINPYDRYVWIHAASLGEFEQGRPLIEMIKREMPDKRIILTFFSPSGYEVRKDYKGADIVTYLPFDTPRNVCRFLDIVNPAMAIFVKYEFWGNYLKQLHKRHIPTFLISAVFRRDQLFFKSYGGFYRRWLKYFNHIFVQDNSSKSLLSQIGIKDVTVAGDTRFDRVADIQSNAKPIPELDLFCGPRSAERKHIVFIAGSSWPEDEGVYADWLKAHPEVKAVIAPHEFDDERLKMMIRLFGRDRTLLLSEARDGGEEISSRQILIIDCFGLLSSAYSYADFVYVGGGFGAGLHNINEAAVYGVPVIYGPNHSKFIEAEEMKTLGGGLAVSSREGFKRVADRMLYDRKERETRGKWAADYIRSSRGATETIFKHIFNIR